MADSRNLRVRSLLVWVCNRALNARLPAVFNRSEMSVPGEGALDCTPGLGRLIAGGGEDEDPNK